MALYKPNQLSPQNTTVDATEINRFTWQTNGGIQTGFLLYILENDTDSGVFSVTVTSPNEYYDLPAGILSNGTDYKWYVTTISGSESQSSEYEFFKANDTPVVTFSSPDFTGGLNEELEYFQSASGWTTNNGVQVADDTFYDPFFGTQSLKITESFGSQLLSTYKTVSYDLTEFENGISSDNTDLIYLKVYINDKSLIDSSGLYIKFNDGVDWYQHYWLNSELSDGWNELTTPKGDFTDSGTPDWSQIDTVTLGCLTTSGGLGLWYQAIQLRQVGDGTNIILSTQDFNFELSYTQDQDVSSKKYKFILSDSNGTEITDTGWIYDFDLAYEFTGLDNNTTYQIEGKVVSQNDQEGSTGVKNVQIIYQNNNALPAIVATVDDDNGYTTIDWSNIVFSEATYSGGTPSYVTGKFNYGLDLPNGEYVQFDDLSDNDCYTLTSWIKMKLGHDGDFCNIDINKSAGYDLSTQRFYYNNDGDYTYSDVITLYSWEDLSGDWTGYASDTWATLGLSGSDYMEGFFFFGITCEDYIIKKANELRVHLDISV